MEKNFEIVKYKPNRKLVLKPKTSSDAITYFIIALVVFLAISFTFITASFFPIIIFAMIAIISWFSLKSQLAQLITFTPNEVIIDYKIGFLTWQGRYNNLLEMDWFVNVNEKPAKIKIGHKDRIILRFSLDNLETLPVLTQNVSEIMSLEVDMNETIGKWENIRLRSPKQLSTQTTFHNITIQNDASSIKILTYGIKRFEINFQKGVLKYFRWLTSKQIELKNIKAIFYHFEYSELSNNKLTNWAYVDKQTNETVLFFKFRPQNDQYAEMHYSELNFKIDNRNLARLLQDLPEFKDIEIKEQKF